MATLDALAASRALAGAGVEEILRWALDAFEPGRCDAVRDPEATLGLKGATLHRLAKLGLPVPPGISVTPHGPAVSTTVTLLPSAEVLRARVYMKARETRADWTEPSGLQDFELYRPPAGWVIERLPGAAQASHWAAIRFLRSGSAAARLCNSVRSASMS